MKKLNISGRARKRKIFKAAVFFLTLALLMPMLVSAADYDSHWAKTIFDDWIAQRLITPDAKGNINPEGAVSKGELISYINKIMGYTRSGDLSKYTDITPSHKYYNDFALASGAGYLSDADKNGTALSPDSTVTRADAISMFARFANLDINGADTGVLAKVIDASAIAAQDKKAVAAAINNGFIAGSGDYTIRPGDPMTRSEAVTMLDRLNAKKRIYAFPYSYGPQTGAVDVNYTSLIAPDSQLKNSNMSIDTNIASSAGNGKIDLTKVNTGEHLIIDGGSVITLNNCKTKDILLNKKDARLIFNDSTNNDTEHLIINGDNCVVDIPKGNKVKKITINGKNVTVNVGENVKIDELIVNSPTANINLAKGSRLETVTLNAKANITGEGSIGSLTAKKEADGSNITPVPDNINIDEGAKVDVNGQANGSVPVKITSGTIADSSSVKIMTEDTGTMVIGADDLTATVNGAAVSGIKVSKTSNTEYKITLPQTIPAEATIRVAGKRNLTGSVTITAGAAAMITSGNAPEAKVISLILSNPDNKIFLPEHFKIAVDGKDIAKFTVTPVSQTEYTLNINTAVKAGQKVTVTGQKELGGTVTFGLMGNVKSITFVDTKRFIVNTDDTTGNKIDAECFDVQIGGAKVTGFTVTEQSKTEYLITIGTDLKEGTRVYVQGMKYLQRSASASYVSPFGVAKVVVNDKNSITVTLQKAPAIALSSSDTAAFQVLVDGKPVTVTNLTGSGADKKGTTYNLSVNLDNLQGKLTVNGVAPSQNKGMIDYVKSTLMSVKIGDRQLTSSAPGFRTSQADAVISAEFSEPVFSAPPSKKFSKTDLSTSGAAFSVSTEKSGGFDINGAKVTVSGNSVTLNLSGCKRVDPGIYTLSINTNMICDAAGNYMNSGTYTYKFDVKGTPPTSATAKQIPEGHLEIKINGSGAEAFGTSMSTGGYVTIMDGINPKVKDISYAYISYDSKTKTITVSRNAYAGTELNSDTYKLIFTHPDYEDFVISKIKIDTKKPELLKVVIKDSEIVPDSERTEGDSLVKVSKQNAQIQLIFSEPVYASPPSSRLGVKNIGFGEAINIDPSDTYNADLTNAKVTSNNRTVTVSLAAAATLLPDIYALKIDGGQIFDSVGNPVDDSINSILSYHFHVIRMPPKVIIARQPVPNGDLSIRFTQYSGTTQEYGADISMEGVIQIVDPLRPEGDQIVGSSITGENLIIWDPYVRTLTVKREALSAALDGYYTLRLIHPDYDTLEIPNVKIITDGPVTYSVKTKSAGVSYTLTNDAMATRIVRTDAKFIVTFSKAVYRNTAKGVFGVEDISATVATAFSVVDEDFTSADDIPNIDFSKAKVTHSNDKKEVTIDLTEALNDGQLGHNIRLTVNDNLIYDAGGLRISNDPKPFRFRLANPAPKIKSITQRSSGELEIVFEKAASDDETLAANIYVNAYAQELLRGCAEMTNFKFENIKDVYTAGIIYGCGGNHSANGIESCMAYSVNEGKLILPQEMLYRTSYDPSHENPGRALLEGKYTVIISHPYYTDARDDAYIDTTAPKLNPTSPTSKVFKDDAGVHVEITLNFHEECTLKNLMINIAGTSDYVQVTDSAMTRSGGDFPNKWTLKFDIAEGKLPSDYIISFTAVDVYANEADYSGMTLAHTAQPHSGDYDIAAGGIQIPGIGYDPEALKKTAEESAKFVLSELPESYGAYFKKDNQRGIYIAAPDTLEILAKQAWSSGDDSIKEDADGFATATTALSAEMLVGIPANAKSVRYTEYADRVKDVKSDRIQLGASINLKNVSELTLKNQITFRASEKKMLDGGGNVTAIEKLIKDDLNYHSQDLIWTVAVPDYDISFYVFEWTLDDDSIIYTYVESELRINFDSLPETPIIEPTEPAEPEPPTEP